MVTRRKRYSQPSRIWPWVSFIVFSLVLILLGYSIIKKKSPAEVLKSIVKSDLAPDDPRRLSKKELIKLLANHENQIKSLRGELDQCLEDDGFKKATISTSSNTLNMRSEAMLSSSVIIKIPNGSEVSVLYFDDRELFLDGAMGQWCKVKYAENEGWVWGNYLSMK